MIFMTKSRQRRGYIARRIGETLDGTDPFASDDPASTETADRDSARQRFAHRLPAWIALACIAAVPIIILAALVTR